MLKIKVHISNWGGRHTCPSAPPGQKQHSTWLFLTNTGHTTPHHTTHTHTKLFTAVMEEANRARNLSLVYDPVHV